MPLFILIILGTPKWTIILTTAHVAGAPRCNPSTLRLLADCDFKSCEVPNSKGACSILQQCLRSPAFVADTRSGNSDSFGACVLGASDLEIPFLLLKGLGHKVKNLTSGLFSHENSHLRRIKSVWPWESGRSGIPPSTQSGKGLIGLYVCMCIYVCMYVCMYVCIYICMCVYVCMYDHRMYVCMNVCMYPIPGCDIF